jgi:hypothetical protein
MTVAANPVAAHVAELDRMLRGPGPVKRSMIAEVRDGLHDAAEAYRAGGLDPQQAAAAAVRDFGTAQEVALLMQEELTVRQGRSTALLVAVTFPVMVVGWDLLWMSGAGGLWSAAPNAVVGLARFMDVASWLVTAVAFTLLLGTFLRRVAPWRITTMIGLTAATGAAFCGGAALVMNLVNRRHAGAVLATNPLAALAVIASGVAFALVLHSAICSLRTAHRPGRSDQRPDPQVG